MNLLTKCCIGFLMAIMLLGCAKQNPVGVRVCVLNVTELQDGESNYQVNLKYVRNGAPVHLLKFEELNDGKGLFRVISHRIAKDIPTAVIPTETLGEISVEAGEIFKGELLVEPSPTNDGYVNISFVATSLERGRYHLFELPQTLVPIGDDITITSDVSYPWDSVTETAK